MEREKSNREQELERKVAALEKTSEMLMDKIEFYQNSLNDHFSAYVKNFQLNKKVIQSQFQIESVTRMLSAERDKLNHILRSLPGVLLILDHNGYMMEVYRGVDFPSIALEGQGNLKNVFGKEFELQVINKLEHSDFTKRGLVYFLYHFKTASIEMWLNVGISAFQGRQIIMSLRDVTLEERTRQNLREQEAQMIQSSKLASLGEMAGGIAHEINNPLTVVASRTQYLLQKLQNNQVDKSKTIDNLQIISRMVERITKITESMRRLSRDAKDEPKTPVFIDQVLTDIKGICGEKFNHEGIDFVLKVDPLFEEKQVLIYPGQLSQVLINLLNNAYDAVEKQAEKFIELSVALDENKCVLIKVRDNGPGVPEEVRTMIFTPFFTTKEVGRGTGIGLGLSKTIIEKHSGHFYLDTEDELTSFVIELPDSLAD